MKNITKLWTQLDKCLAEIGPDNNFTEEIYQKFDEIFDLKEVAEYKAALNRDWLTPELFQNVVQVMKRALVEGYLLAQAEQRKENIKNLYNCYKNDIKGDDNEKSNSYDRYSTVPRCSFNESIRRYDTSSK